MTIATEEAKQHAIKQLRTILPKGSTVYTILKHISRSGMFRIIDLIYIKENQPWHVPYGLLEDIGFKYNSRHEGIARTGAGMDMGFDLVYSLSRKLYGFEHDNAYALNHKWL